MSENAINGVMGTQPLSASIASEAMIGTPNAGPVIMNDYLLKLTDIVGGHQLTVTRGAEVQKVDILNGKDGVDGASDWNDIQNKPFGEERTEDYLLPETTFEMTENNGTGAFVYKLNAFPEAGQTYKVMWNGTEYSCAAIGEEDAGALLIFIGNAFALEAGPDTGEPFAFVLVGNEKTASALGMSGMLFALDGSASAIVSIFGLADFIYKLDKKYVDLGEPSNIRNDEAPGSVRAITASIGQGEGSAAFGIRTAASGRAAFAEGQQTYANAENSHAEGFETHADGPRSHAEGLSSSATGANSHAEGACTAARGAASHAEGDHTVAHGENQHVQGRSNIEDKEGKYAHIVGNGGILGQNRSNAHTLDWDGNAWYKGDVFTGGEGQEDPAAEKLVKTSELAKALQNLPKPEDGISPTVSVEDIDGGHRVIITDANGPQSFDVLNGKDSGGGSGSGAAIIDVTTLPETDINEDVFYRLLSAEFYYNKTPQTTWVCEVVDVLPEVGEPAADATMTRMYLYYVASTGAVSGYIDQMLAYGLGIPVGWYPAETLSQVAGLSYGGVVSSAAEMTALDTMYLLIQDSVKYRNNDTWNNVQGIGWTGTNTAAEIFNSLSNTASGSCSHAEGFSTTAGGDYSHAEGRDTTASGYASHAEGQSTIASGYASHAEGQSTIASGQSAHAEGDGTTASGTNSHAEGDGTTASGSGSHAEGSGTTAERNYSHAEGWGTTASGQSAHAEGDGTTASGSGSHAEGSDTTASGNYSHAEGQYTIASGDNQHVQGKFNVEDTENKYAHIVGNGESTSDRSNAHTLDWNGVGWFKGGVRVGGIGQYDGDWVVMVNGDSEIILKSQNGRLYKITVSDSGELTTASLV